MKLYFAWIASDEVFDPQQHARQDERIVSLRLSQEEGQPAILKIVVPNLLDRLTFFQERRVGLLSVAFQEGEATPLFKGRLISFETTEDPTCLGLILEASPDDLATQMEKAADTVRQTEAFDPLFVDTDIPQDPKEVEKVEPIVFHVDRKDHQVTLTPFSKGNLELEVGGDFFKDSLRLIPKWVPASGVHMTVEAQWLQRVRGFLDLGRRIANLFPEKMINTFTGKGLQKAWPKKGQPLGRSGYWVASSRLEEVFPPSSLYPKTSQPIKLRSGAKEKLLKRFWFKASLLVGWAYRQKRIETLTFTLNQRLHPLFQAMRSGEPHRLLFRLQDINPVVEAPFWEPDQFYEEGDMIQHEGWLYACKQTGQSKQRFEDAFKSGDFEKEKPIETPLGISSRSSFFVTDRGHQAFAHALARAKTYLAHQARCFEVTFAGTWETLCHITLQHQVHLLDSRLPAGKIQGKAISYVMVADPDTKLFEVKVCLGVSVGDPKIQESPEQVTTEGLYALDYNEPDYIMPEKYLQQSKDDIWFERYDAQVPQDRFSTLAHQEFSYFIKKLNLKHGGHDQAALLQQEAQEGSFFQDKATKLQLQFMPLKGEGAIEHRIEAKILSAYRAPCHVS